MAGKSTPNALISESSPYLLQHAYNPVKWLPYSQAAFEKAQTENKLVLISIGYSACHWCHVMEHESFENEEVAALMNEHFVNIKVDREERSDVDMVYMQAVQLMTGQGGWPLNCFALPDGRPVYGGTYFNRQQWMNVLRNLSDLYKNDTRKVLEYADNLVGGMKQSELIVTGKKSDEAISFDLLKSAVKKWKSGFDPKFGGPARAPKFPLPGNYLFLMRYGIMERDREVTDHVQLTLQTMANGGIYDQLRGGFARYSVDLEWKVPHFEKMLYDNAQLVSLYCEAYSHFKNPLYKKIVTETLDFVSREWQLPEGGFYSAYDADSEGEEGKYYVWTKDELRELLKDNFDLFAEAYGINEMGYWEHDNYILMRNHHVSLLAVKYKMSLEELSKTLEDCKQILRHAAEKRVKPGLDDKTITSWNAMMCSAYARAHQAFGDEKYKHSALASLQFILKQLRDEKGELLRTYKNGKAKIHAFLEDYAFVTEALMEVYTITADEQYLQLARQFADTALEKFHNPESALLFYTSSAAESLVTRSTEASDNVIPASNSQMALNLFYLSQHFSEPAYAEKAVNMLAVVQEELGHYAPGYSNWGCLALHLTRPFRQVAIVGNNVDEKMLELRKHSFTNTILAVSRSSSNLPLLLNRYTADQTLFYVCENNTCQLPVATVEEALEQF